MNNYDIGSKKFLLIMIIILLFFFLLIVKAFDFLADQDVVDEKSRIEDVTKAIEMRNNNPENNNEKNSEEDISTKNNSEEKSLDIKLQIPKNTEYKEEIITDVQPVNNIEGLEPIGAVDSKSSKELSSEEEIELMFLTAQKYTNEKQYVKALEEYNNIKEKTSDTALVARCYENMAGIYAIVKRYGTALSYAQKAYNLSPSTSREMLLARLYYKTGEIDKATKRVNNILQRDFSLDR